MIPSNPFHPHSKRRRGVLALLLIGAVLLTLGAAFFRTQIVQNSDFALRSDDNRLRVIPIPAPRGTVFDRHGHPIAETTTAYSLLLRPRPEAAARVVLRRVAEAVPLDSARVEQLLDELVAGGSQPVLVAGALDFAQAAWVEEHRTELPGLVLERRPQRRYPEGEAVAHLIGYTAEISEREMADPRWAEYRLGQLIGKAGIEREYEALLGGTPGERYVEVDARGRIIGALIPQATRPPRPGRDLTLTLDLELQRFVHSVFPRGYAGAVVALEPRTGEVLALYSHPTFDPDLLTGGAPAAVWRGLVRDSAQPLLNRAVAGIYPPGSTWKLATALIGLETGVVDPASPMPIACTGGMSYAGRYSRCWKRDGHGDLDLVGAIAHSCNVYFYQLGIWLGLGQITREGTRLGFARPTGIDLPGERGGTFPTGAAWYRERFGSDAQPSEVMNLAIGQGPNSQTPLRMAQFFAALAGDGTAPAPRLRAGLARSAEPEVDLGVAPRTLGTVRQGLARVLEEGGTAYAASLQRWQLSGKTGTSQNAQHPDRPHAWFTGFAGEPGGEAEIALAVVVELGESGSRAAAPLGAKIADFYLNGKHGLPTDSLQTLAERASGRVFRLP